MLDPIAYALCKGFGGGLPVVELTTVATGTGEALTYDEAENMDALNGDPAIIKATLSGGIKICGFFACIRMGERMVYELMLNNGSFLEIVYDGVAWTIMFVEQQ